MKPEVGIIMDDGVDGDDVAGDIEECYGRGDERVINVAVIGGWKVGGLEVVVGRSRQRVQSWRRGLVFGDLLTIGWYA